MKSEIMIKVLGLRRSGNHFIINWIGKSKKKEYLHINNLSIKLDKAFGLQTVKGKLKKKFEEKLKKTIMDFETPILICSFEDALFQDVFKDKKFNKNFKGLFGTAKEDYNILILRDAFNVFASLLFSKRIDENNLNKYVELWKNNAREFLNCNKNSNFIAINYNMFFTSKEYRNQIAIKLKMRSNEKILKKVAYHGSSFDKFKFNAQKMQVLERWKIMKDNKIYKDIFKDEELIKLSEEIFGKIPGTEII